MGVQPYDRSMRSLLATLLLVLSAVPAAAKTYFVERFDARIRVVAGGAIEVTETAIFHFQDGSFDHVFRDIPTHRTDGVDVLSAAMDGQPLPFGTGAGEVEVRRGSPIKVRWRFTPQSGTRHVFTLTYVARGVVRRDADRDVLEWIALPTKHDYRIGSSDIVLEYPSAPIGVPVVSVSHVGEHSVEPSSTRVQVNSTNVRKDGWIKARVDFASGTVIAASPLWQQRRAYADSFAPQWLIAAGVIVAAGVVLLFGLRQRYDSPPQIDIGSRAYAAPPDTLRPALAGVLASRGRVSLHHAMATLFGLADRGVVTVEEEPRRWGQRRFNVHRRQREGPLKPEEQELLVLAFPADAGADAGVPVATVRNRIARHMRKYRDRVRDELRGMGLLDDDRERVRRLFRTWAVGLFVLAIATIIPAVFLTRTFEGWPFVVPGAIAIVGLGALIGYGVLTPLSNEGVRRAAEWRAYARHLKDVARDRTALTNSTPVALLPFAVALGLAGSWSKFVKHHHAALPAWFHAVGSHDDGAFPAFIAAGGAADASGASGGGGGGAAGGGASGAG